MQEADQVSVKTADDRTAALRHAFVGMLFALVAAQIAFNVINLVGIWHESGVSPGWWAALLQTILALAILTTSWVGWSRTAIPKHRDLRLRGVFGRPYVLLVVDVILVIIYFGVARSTEVAEELEIVGDSVVTTRVTLRPSALAETFGVVLLFAVYLLWDVLMKVWRPIGKSGEYLREHSIRGWSRWKFSYLQTRASVLCVVWSFLLFYLVWVHRYDANTWFVLLADIWLILLIFMFRLAKYEEQGSAERFGLPKGAVVSREPIPRWPFRAASALLIALMIVIWWVARN